MGTFPEDGTNTIKCSVESEHRISSQVQLTEAV